ncbi:DUF4296 domain-containing protein [Weeksellaceae bacterium KMM 9713]|uniref:DUF4296 domain-containing protein n=1 Tax=Profundicola chukchiensis TaxID=2961959 RepID=A0A9X4MVL7_9FLAO|nr:DUF4296 domain-containing protein [Profundicola chukchiensis]MDG4945668.1 DUF4296 domain-containing protein [Profundicola chukchiensis]
MKKLIIYSLMFFAFLACNKEMEKPKDLILRETMVSILKDVYVFKQVKNYRVAKDLPAEEEANVEVLRKHNVSLDQFKRSYQYYIIDNAAYDVLLDEVKKELEAELPPEALEIKEVDKTLPPSAQ